MAWSISRLVKYLFLSSCFARSSVVLEASSRFGRMEVDMTETVNSKAPVSDGPCDEIKLFCRPSFLIIGAGKSGTSSLYYYLQDHPQVEPAHMKQVQFFDHQFHRGADWYYRKHFPQRMIKGHVTGESSPGYIVYSQIPDRVRSLLPQVKIIAILREPIDRVWSSYHYNYVDLLKAKRPLSVVGLGSFIEVEMDMLNVCLQSKGYDKRKGSASSKPIDFVNDCFGPFKEATHLNLIKAAHQRSSKHPAAFPAANAHLFRQFVSRGLYSLMLEHWYQAFPTNQIRVICTESLAPHEGSLGLAVQTLEEVSRFIELDRFDFTATVSQGKFNDGSNRGYSKVTKWEDVEEHKYEKPEIPRELHNTLLNFYSPFNERLFELTSNRCQWP